MKGYILPYRVRVLVVRVVAYVCAVAVFRNEVKHHQSLIQCLPNRLGLLGSVG